MPPNAKTTKDYFEEYEYFTFVHTTHIHKFVTKTS